MTRSDGAVELFGSIAYAPQNPWIMSTTVRDNITFFHHFDAEFYEAVLDGMLLFFLTEWLSGNTSNFIIFSSSSSQRVLYAKTSHCCLTVT